MFTPNFSQGQTCSSVLLSTCNAVSAAPKLEAKTRGMGIPYRMVTVA